MKIKKQINYILIVVLILLTSCSGLLDVESINTTSPQGFINDRQSANNALASIYVTARRAVAEEGAWLAFSDLRSGHLKMNSITGLYIAKQNLLAPTKALNQYSNWNYFLESVAQCNTMLENIDNASSTLTEREYNSIKGQSYFIRAFMNFYMTQIWGDCPLITSTDAPKDVARTPKSDVLKSVIEDASKAFDLLPIQHTDVNGNVNITSSVRYANKVAAIILLIKANVYAGNYTEAVKWYETLPVVDKLRVYRLEFGDALPRIYAAQSNETVFGFNLSGNDYTTSIGNAFTKKVFFNGENKSLIQVSSSQYVTSLYAATDFRRTKLFEINGTNVALLKHSDAFLLMFRMTDAVLFAAEAYAKLGKNDNALSLVNQVRLRSGLKELFDLKGDPLLNEIKLEFEQEYFGEGKLFFEWNRWGILAGKVPTISAEQYNAGIAYWPISEDAFKSNSQILQNPFWLN